MRAREIGRWLRRIASAFNIWPNSDYSKHMPRGSSEDRIRVHWSAAGDHLASTIDKHTGKPNEGKSQQKEDANG